ncbi:hypothetical protein UP09_31010 [Bradyrhizobium sp. LTSP885]|uniref:hypothetical protein n=1 Tax=Bradyrhizobium sp. LTSP885 TaxID=1619232 RepID=UPI0005CB6097|nr:hypothetical protein [Bradyrhizobium sp. LTSP885]KJC35656.1 hypothetical protein UP09_31010 [Bradyrhizobium sp. LTSP885]
MNWQKFEDDDRTPKDQRLVLITQPSGTPDGAALDTHDIVVGHWNKHVWGFVIADEPNQTPSGAKLVVRYWATLTDLPPVQLRHLDGML